MVAPTLNAEEYQFLDQGVGVKLNGASALPFVDLETVIGFDSPVIRFSSTAREGSHGSYTDAEFEDGRTVVLEGNVYASPTALEAYLDSLKANYAPNTTPQPFYVGTDSGMRMLLAKSLGLKYDKQRSRSHGLVEIQVTLIADDPRLYSPTETVLTGAGTLALGGNRDTTGKISIAGARTNPTITVNSIALAFTYTLAAGNTIVIDLDKRTVILNGITNLRDKMVVTGGKWPKLTNGNNTIGVSSSAGTGTVTTTARSAWR